ncbi:MULTISPECIES: STAS domain-containing protein [unclassified Oceanispirochaeta]|uniref:STAS domain-containing protein n=1 Tax=unclassified Oceanispirochaeta TaxID=2635722 RepID=UPI000E092DC0|nr:MULTISPECIES: STAS domain-containing protein [unclassified Oceanispirochaeta]MBF9018308.1 STAS domain-containing protein [Oceanispirochaeta sp. M2]NPD74773.1 STAS domain-containing protein [Oceanispirochaeta sp. M1]RDG29385.1 anti-sigma factor antagonist [Oceanispirochaeta sp. M1]
MELKVRKSKHIYIIDIEGEMDLYNAYKLKELVGKMLEKGIAHYVVNMEKVEYIDSSGIGALIYVSSALKKKNAKLVITGVHGSVKKVIELTKLTGYFPLEETLKQGILKLMKG